MLFACVITCDRALVSPRSAGRPDSQLAQGLFEEVLAYGLSRLQSLMESNEYTGADEWLWVVKQECAAFKRRQTWGRLNSRKKLGTPPTQVTTLALKPFSQTESEFRGRASRVTKEMFEQFCQHTGLGSSVLVGKGENLATLVFYIALHAVWSTHRKPLAMAQIHKLPLGVEAIPRRLRGHKGFVTAVRLSELE